MVASLIILMNGFKQAGISPGTVPKTLPSGVLAISGWVNRLLVLINSIWSLTAAGKIIHTRLY
jgi:hypothetical protein